MWIMCMEPQLLSHSLPKPAANECVGFVLTAEPGLYIEELDLSHHMIGLNRGRLDITWQHTKASADATEADMRPARVTLRVNYVSKYVKYLVNNIKPNHRCCLTCMCGCESVSLLNSCFTMLKFTV